MSCSAVILNPPLPTPRERSVGYSTFHKQPHFAVIRPWSSSPKNGLAPRRSPHRLEVLALAASRASRLGQQDSIRFAVIAECRNRDTRDIAP